MIKKTRSFAQYLRKRESMTTSALEGGRNDKLFNYFLMIWVIAGLVQNYFTEVNGEEAYYWLFSQYPAWGYLDHPPMVSFVTAPFYWLFSNNLGLRLGMLLCSVLTMIVVRNTLGKKDDRLLVWIFASLLAVHVGAYHVKTDVPLLLGVALFFNFYKKYLENDGLKTVVLLAFSIALIMLSKHHGFLMVIFTVVSNPKLFLKKSFWLVVVFTTLFMIPHTLWQFSNDFATIKFHLYNRIDMGFSWTTIAYYVGVQPLVFGPFIGVLLIGAAFANKAGGTFNRALKYCLAGVFVFFLISSFKVEFHKHWTSVLLIPLILLGHEYIRTAPKWRLWMKRLMIVSVVIVIPARIYLMYDFFPKSWTKDWDVLHNWDTWAEEVKTLSGGLPIMFNNHYERSSRYSYLTGDIVHCYNTFDYRETQHDLMDLEEQLQGKRVFQINRYRDTTRYADYYTEIGKGIHYRIIENFRSYRKVEITAEDAEGLQIEGNEITLELTLTNNYDYNIDFSDADGRKVYLNAHFLKGLTEVLTIPVAELTDQMGPGGSITKLVKFAVPDVSGEYDLRFSVQVEGIEPPINSKKYPVVVD